MQRISLCIFVVVCFFCIEFSSSTSSTSSSASEQTGSWNPSGGLRDFFDEDLLLQPLADGRMFVHFQFTTETAQLTDDYYLFPRSLGQLIQKYRIKELRLSLTQGRWLAQRWGQPLVGAPSGAELLAQFDPALDPALVDQHWAGAVNTLSGLLCASLQELSQPATHTQFTPPGQLRSTRPPDAWTKDQFVAWLRSGDQNSGDVHHSTINNKNNNSTRGRRSVSHTRRGVLPGETVCTENLTPWGKLLPCQRQQGLARLLNPEAIYDVNYHSQGLHIFSLDDNGNDNDDRRRARSFRLVQTMSLVTKHSALINPSVATWSLFESTGTSQPVTPCPMSRKARVFAVQPDAGVTVQLHPLSSDQPPPVPVASLLNYEHVSPGSLAANVVVYNLNEHKQTMPDVRYQWESSSGASAAFNQSLIAPASGVAVSRFLSGQGQAHGGLSTYLFNHDAQGVLVSYFDALPWQLRVYFHTMKFQLRIHPDGHQALGLAHPFHFDRKNMIPAEDHGSPNLIEFTVYLPPHSSLHFHVEFDKAFMHWTEYPPDAHKGYDVGSAAVVVHSGGSFTGQMRKTGHSFGLDWLIERAGRLVGRPRHSVVYTDNLTFELPTPDFSMPYNVVCLSGTVFALFFGNLFNVLIRRLGDLRQGTTFVSDRPLAKLLRKLRAMAPKWKQKLFGSSSGSGSSSSN